VNSFRALDVRLPDPGVPNVAVGVLTVGVIALGSAGMLWFGILLATLVGLALLGLKLGLRVRVGADGVLIRRGCTTRFVDYDALEAASLEAPTEADRWWKLVLKLHEGDTIRLQTTQRGGTSGSDDEIGRPLMLAITARLEARRAATPVAALQPDERPSRAWLANLRRIGQPDYRTRALERARLETLVDDPGADVATRVAAAVALEAAGGERARLRILLDQLVHPPQRKLVDDVLRARDDDELVASLGRLAARRRR